MNIKKVGFYSVVLFLSFLSLKLLFSHHFGYTNTGLKSVLKNKPADILIIGSSHVRFSYDTKKMEELCQCTVRSVSYSFLNYPLILPILELLANENKLPTKKLIIDHYSLIYFKEREFVDTRLFFESPLPLKIDILSYMFENFKKLNFKDYFRFIVSSENEMLLNFPINNPIVDSRNYNGSYQKKHVPSMSSKRYQNLKISTKHFNFNKYSQIEEDYLLAIHQFIGKQKIEYQLVETPLPIGIYKTPRLQAFLNSQKNKYSQLGIPFIDTNDYFEEMNLDFKSFMDDNHLSSHGRIQFSVFFTNNLVK